LSTTQAKTSDFGVKRGVAVGWVPYLYASMEYLAQSSSAVDLSLLKGMGVEGEESSTEEE